MRFLGLGLAFGLHNEDGALSTDRGGVDARHNVFLEKLVGIKASRAAPAQEGSMAEREDPNDVKEIARNLLDW